MFHTTRIASCWASQKNKKGGSGRDPPEGQEGGGGLLHAASFEERLDVGIAAGEVVEEAEGIGSAAMLGAVDSDPTFEEWYRRIWGFVSNHVIDPRGGWIPELDSNLAQVNRVFVGKPDLYHALQACIIPLLPADGSITKGLIGRGSTPLLAG